MRAASPRIVASCGRGGRNLPRRSTGCGKRLRPAPVRRPPWPNSCNGSCATARGRPAPGRAPPRRDLTASIDFPLKRLKSRCNFKAPGAKKNSGREGHAVRVGMKSSTFYPPPPSHRGRRTACAASTRLKDLKGAPVNPVTRACTRAHARTAVTGAPFRSFSGGSQHHTEASSHAFAGMMWSFWKPDRPSLDRRGTKPRSIRV